MKDKITFILILLASFTSYSQLEKLGYINCGAISENTNCGVGELFVISDVQIKKQIATHTHTCFDGGSSFYAYPNPVKDIIYIVSSIKIASVNIFDISGKLVMTETIIDNKINVSDLIKGTYLLFSEEQKFETFTIIKE